MADFINTIDALGDDAVIDSIINRSITEFKDDRVTSIQDHVFIGCTSLASVEVPNVTGILGRSAFNGCAALKEITLPLVTAITSESASGSGTFAGCTCLQKADLPSVTSIGGRAFMNCYVLTALILRKTDAICALTSSNAFPSTPIIPSGSGTTIKYGTGYIYVPRALVDSYKIATNWSTYATQFRALEDYTIDGTTTGELDETKI